MGAVGWRHASGTLAMQLYGEKLHVECEGSILSGLQQILFARRKRLDNLLEERWKNREGVSTEISKISK